jgi:hypothetical protein
MVIMCSNCANFEIYELIFIAISSSLNIVPFLQQYKHDGGRNFIRRCNSLWNYVIMFNKMLLKDVLNYN